MPREQGGYSFHIAVDPGSPGDGTNDRIYFGVVGQARSTNSGASFTGLGGLHATRTPGRSRAQPAPRHGRLLRKRRWHLPLDRQRRNWIGRERRRHANRLFYNLDVSPDATASTTVGALKTTAFETHRAADSGLEQPSRAGTAGTSTTTAQPPGGCSPRADSAAPPVDTGLAVDRRRRELEQRHAVGQRRDRGGLLPRVAGGGPGPSAGIVYVAPTRTSGRPRTAAPPGGRSARSPPASSPPRCRWRRRTPTTSSSPTAARCPCRPTRSLRRPPSPPPPPFPAARCFAPRSTPTTRPSSTPSSAASPAAGRPVTCSARRSARRAGRTSRRRASTCRSAPSRSTAPTRRARSTWEPISVCCGRSTAERRGTSSTTSTSRRAPVTDS